MEISLQLNTGQCVFAELPVAVSEDMLTELISTIKKKGIELTLVDNKLIFLYQDMPANTRILNLIDAVYSESEIVQATATFQSLLNASWGLPETFEEQLAKVALLPIEQRDKAKKELAKKFEMKASSVDAASKGLNKTAKDSLQQIREVMTPLIPAYEPYEHPVDASELLDDMYTYFKRRLYMRPELHTMAPIWCAYTFFQLETAYAPIAFITAPLENCGKTALMDLMSFISCRPYTPPNITVPVLTRILEACKPTLFFDEADNFIKDNIEFNGMLNLGVKRQGSDKPTLVTVGSELQLQIFNTFGPKCVCGIGAQARTLESRAVIFRMERMPVDETRESYLAVTPKSPEVILLNKKLLRFYNDNKQAFEEIMPEMPSQLRTRAADVWLPLFKIAALAGEKWVNRVNEASLALWTLGKSLQKADDKQALISDMFDIFASYDNPVFLSTTTLILDLTGDEEKQWSTFCKGHSPLTPHVLGALIKQFQLPEIHSRRMSIDKTEQRGWLYADIKKLYSMYN